MDGEAHPHARTARSPATAALLSVLFPGLGHQYVGEARLARRILVSVGVGWAAVTTVTVLLDRAPLLGVAFSLAIGLSTMFGLAVDARRRAQRHVEGYELRPCNRPGAYAIYFCLWVVLVVIPNELRSAYVIEAVKMPSSSSEPTLMPGDNFVVTKLTERDRNPQRGDIVLFRYPLDPRERFAKRVIGLPGETVEIRGGLVSIDGVPLGQERVAAPAGASARIGAEYFVETTPEGASYTVRRRTSEDDEVSARTATYAVPPGHMFVLGDSRSESLDSREFGPVALHLLDGRARAIYLPLSRIGDLR